MNVRRGVYAPVLPDNTRHRNARVRTVFIIIVTTTAIIIITIIYTCTRWWRCPRAQVTRKIVKDHNRRRNFYDFVVCARATYRIPYRVSRGLCRFFETATASPDLVHKRNVFEQTFR